mgnify:CR=1 FL=1
MNAVASPSASPLHMVSGVRRFFFALLRHRRDGALSGQGPISTKLFLTRFNLLKTNGFIVSLFLTEMGG